jgi:Methyltransferase domain
LLPHSRKRLRRWRVRSARAAAKQALCAGRSRRCSWSSAPAVSTLVHALALSRNGTGHLWSVDSEEKWAAATESALPELRTLVTIVRSPIAEDDRDVPGLAHSRLPDLQPDFVYVDGPPLAPTRRVSFDVVDIEATLQPGCLIMIDGRRDTVRYLNGHLSRPHTHERPYVGWHLIEILS